MTDIATLNDKFRKSFIGGEVLLSAGIAAMSSEDKANIVSLVQNFNDFTEDNNVYGERDFGSFDYKDEKILKLIDVYNAVGLDNFMSIIEAFNGETRFDFDRLF